MAIREIRKEGDEILSKKCREVEEITEKILELGQDMLDTMYKYDGIGLAASQVGILKRVIVYDIKYFEEDEKPEPHILINPVITSRSKTMIEVEEGCLSFPDVYEKVLRHEKVTVEYMDTKGKKKKINAKDIEAVVLQHEIDHLDGIVFLDRVEEQK
ncbi:MAG: peptide deformylase [Clostridia bacterium]|jgi:peptide deformylase|nr:peptide deformylase [Clostridia bacterium]